MRRFSRSMIAILAAVLLVGGAGFCLGQESDRLRPTETSFASEGERPAKIIVADDSSYAPFSFFDTEGNPSGVTIDIWRLWSRKTGIPVEFHLMEWESVLASVRNGEADVVAGLFRTPQREEIFNFTHSFYQISTGVFFQRQIMGIRGMNELNGFLVGVVRGDSAEDRIREQNPAIRLILYADTESMVKAALGGEIKVFIADTYVARFYLAKNDAGNEFLEAFDLVTDNELYAAVRKGNRQLLDVVQQGFDQISTDEIRKIVDSWTGISVFSRIPWTSLWTVISVIAAALTAMIVWNLQLKRKIAQATNELRKRNEDLERSERNYREIFNATSDMIFIHDAKDGRILDVNQATLDLCGYSKEQLTDTSITALKSNSPIFDGEEVLRRIQKAVAEGFYVFEWLTPRIDGSSFWTEVSLRTSRIGGENRVLAVVRDISERKRAEEALRESELSFKTFFELAPYACTVSDWDNHYLMVNRAFCTLSGHRVEESIGFTPYELGIVHQPESVNTIRDELIQSGEVMNREMTVRCKNGEIRHVLFSSRMIKLEGKPAFLATTVDITERKRAEEALRESEAKYRLLLDHSSDLIWNMNAEGIFTYVSPSWKRVTGYEPSSIQGAPFQPLVHPDDLHLCVNYLQETIQTKTIVKSQEYRVRHANGDWHWHTTNGSPVLGPDGEFVSLVGVSRDITERKRAEEELLREQLLTKKLLDSLPGIFYLYTYPELRLVRWNKNHETLLGYNSGEIKNRSIMDWHVPEAKKAVIQAIDIVMEKGQNTIESPLLTKEGHAIPFLMTGVKLEVPGQTYLMGVGVDITELKKAEEALRESENRFRSMMEQSPLSIQVFSPQGDILQMNDACFRLWNVSKELAKNYNILKDQQLLNVGIMPLIQRAFAGERVSISEIEYDLSATLGQGNRKFVQSDLYPLKDEDGAIRYIILVHQDITDRKRMEEEREKLQEQLVHAQKMESVGRLAGGVAHDFNNMLGVITGHAELALMEINPDQPIYNSLKEIEKAAHRSADLTRQLLAFARKQTIAPKVLDLNEAIEGMLKMLRRLIGEDIHLSWLPGLDLGSVMIDPSQVDQIMANLCVNARDAIAGVGKITIETENAACDGDYCADHAGFIPGAYVMLAVSDDGCGMDKETQEKIFEPFFTTKGMGQGTGLGLSTVFGIVKQNNGFINVYSEPGKGSTFKIYLPRIVENHVEIQGVSGVELPQCGGETVLLVEDEPMILELGKAMLEMLGYRVLSTGAPGEAIRLAEENAGEIHLLITDVVMPDMNGRDLAVRLLSRYPNLKMLFMSGYTANVIAHQGVLDEGVVFLQKPFSMKDLSAKVREALDK